MRNDGERQTKKRACPAMQAILRSLDSFEGTGVEEGSRNKIGVMFYKKYSDSSVENGWEGGIAKDKETTGRL